MRDDDFEYLLKFVTLEGILKQFLSDFCSGRERAANGNHFEALRNSPLLYRLNLKVSCY